LERAREWQQRQYWREHPEEFARHLASICHAAFMDAVVAGVRRESPVSLLFAADDYTVLGQSMVFSVDPRNR
jgi:hypothetical protein